MKGWTIAGIVLAAFVLFALYEYTQGSDPVSAISDAIASFTADDPTQDDDDTDGSDDSGNSGTGGGVEMTYSQQLRTLIKGWEGTGPDGPTVAYKDMVGVWTIGWGSTLMPDGSPVVQGDTLPDEQAAEDLLDQRLSQFSTAINNMVMVPVNQSQFDALVGWAYNVGIGAAQSSTLLRLLNSGDYAGADGQFLVWVKGTVGGVFETIKGLVNRETTITSLFGGN